jgi:hypothetical protein
VPNTSGVCSWIYPLGAPNDVALQTRIILSALALLAENVRPQLSVSSLFLFSASRLRKIDAPVRGPFLRTAFPRDLAAPKMGHGGGDGP